MDRKADDEKLVEFRNILRKIKESILKVTYNTQNTGILNKVPERLKQFYTLLKPVVYHNKNVDVIPIEELRDLFYSTLQEYPRSSYYQNHLEYYLDRDFIKYPFVIDEDRIDSFNVNDTYETAPIVLNNIDLTE